VLAHTNLGVLNSAISCRRSAELATFARLLTAQGAEFLSAGSARLTLGVAVGAEALRMRGAPAVGKKLIDVRFAWWSVAQRAATWRRRFGSAPESDPGTTDIADRTIACKDPC